MEIEKEDYAKISFENVALIYDKIEFFKISAKHINDIIAKHKTNEKMDILDIACGTGNVVLECASSMPNAKFDALDLSQTMLDIAKENASKRLINNINFHIQDITKMPLDKKYDIITCSYAMFFLPNVQDLLKTIMKQLKPNGIFIFTTFLKESFSPSSEILISLLQKYGSSSAKKYDANKWENLTSTKDINYLCNQANINNFQINTKKIRYDLNIKKWWELFNNTGYKGMLMELDKKNYENVKIEFFNAMDKISNTNNTVELVADSYFVILTNN